MTKLAKLAGPLARATPASWRSYWRTGLVVVDVAEVAIPISFPTLDDAWRAHTSAGPVQKVIQAAGEDAVRRVLDAVLTAHRRPDGMFRQDNVMRYVIATKP